MIEDLIEKITKAIGYAYKKDGTVPGLTVAWLHFNQEYYVAIIRWIEGEKIVQYSQNAASLEDALRGLANKFLMENFVKSPIEDLLDFMRASSSEARAVKTTSMSDYLNPLVNFEVNHSVKDCAEF